MTTSIAAPARNPVTTALRQEPRQPAQPEDSDQQEERPGGERDRGHQLGRVVPGHAGQQDRAAGHGRERRAGTGRDVPRRAEQRVDDRAGGRRVEPILHRYTGDARVAEVLGHDHRRDRDAGDDVAAQPRAVVRARPAEDRDEARKARGRLHLLGGHRAKCPIIASAGRRRSAGRTRGHEARSDVRCTASARSLRARRCASTRLAERRPTEPDQDPGPAVERLERRRVDHPRPAGHRFELPAPLAVEPRRRHAQPEAGVRARLEALDAGRRRGAGRAGRGPSGSWPPPARSARPARDRSSGKSAVRRTPDRGGSPRRSAATRGRRRAARRPVRAAVVAGVAGSPPPDPVGPPSSDPDRVPDRLHLEEGGDPLGALGGAVVEPVEAGVGDRRAGGAGRA